VLASFNSMKVDGISIDRPKYVDSFGFAASLCKEGETKRLA
jgi:hypothetical protein